MADEWKYSPLHGDAAKKFQEASDTIRDFLAAQTNPPAQICPTCGHCPTCGRNPLGIGTSPSQPLPWYPAPRNWWINHDTFRVHDVWY